MQLLILGIFEKKSFHTCVYLVNSLINVLFSAVFFWLLYYGRQR